MMWTFRNELEPRWDYLKAYEQDLIPSSKDSGVQSAPAQNE